jgi:hypothetical protein
VLNLHRLCSLTARWWALDNKTDTSTIDAVPDLVLDLVGSKKSSFHTTTLA